MQNYTDEFSHQVSGSYDSPIKRRLLLQSSATLCLRPFDFTALFHQNMAVMLTNKQTNKNEKLFISCHENNFSTKFNTTPYGNPF